MDCVVDLEHGKCDCGVYAVEKILCSHAIAGGTSAGLHISTLVCPMYSKDFLFAGYSENIYPCVGQQVEECTCFPPDVKRGPGRQKKSRWQSWLELSRMRGRKPQDLQLSRPEGPPVSRPGFFLPEDLQVSRPMFSFPEDLQLSRPEGPPVSRPGFFLPEDLQCDCGVYAVEKIHCSHAIAAGTSAGLHISTLDANPGSNTGFIDAQNERKLAIRNHNVRNDVDDLQVSRPEGRPVSRPEFFLPEDLQVSRPVFSLPEDLQISRPEDLKVSRPRFFLPEDLQVSRPAFSLPEDLQVSRPGDLKVSRPEFFLPEDLQVSRPEGRPVSRLVFILPKDL
ncbi:hypothetical protein F2Q69_00044649 [Brassica cretica]|uniref:SWIM-type domain-containing protein n=1 Tax=Brassica cretica TaxID=69181 RepID=A0A8S9NQT6_BRACR|nr:hypothetical protein F2Q69_00044649 [Brassica cretica]